MLTGGGARAAYQLGVLKYIYTEMKEVPESPVIIGTSAGAINAYYLAAKAHEGFPKAITDLCNFWSNLKTEDIYKTDLWSILKIAGNFLYNFTVGRYVKERHIESLLDTTPLYLLLRRELQEDYHHLPYRKQSTVHVEYQ